MIWKIENISCRNNVVVILFVYAARVYTCIMEEHMTISERLFRIMEKKNISMSELSRMTGISRNTIFDWHKKNTNPGSDKIMAICRALEITPEQLLTGIGFENEEEISSASPENRFTLRDIQMIEDYHSLKEEQQKRLMAYMAALKKIESLEDM